MKRVILNIEGPGSSGTLAMDASEAEVQFLERLMANWNEANPDHAAPFMELEVYNPVEKRDEKRS